jgi:hypothetical protein
MTSLIANTFGDYTVTDYLKSSDVAQKIDRVLNTQGCVHVAYPLASVLPLAFENTYFLCIVAHSLAILSCRFPKCSV